MASLPGGFQLFSLPEKGPRWTKLDIITCSYMPQNVITASIIYCMHTY